MSVITNIPEPNLWTEICKEFASRRTLHDEQKLPLEVNYDACKHTPVFFGPLHKRVIVDGRVDEDFDAAISHPACVGYAFIERPPDLPPPKPLALPDRMRCSPSEYLEHFVFPVLLPALEELLLQAKTEKCFERKRTKFNACDFLTEYLYKNNPLHPNRGEISFAEIPFVQEWWTTHPRAPLAKSLLWTEEEAIQFIQSFWRGYKVREEESVQELRQWQKECREESQNIHEAVNKFWADKIPSDPENEEITEPGEPTQLDPPNQLENTQVEAKPLDHEPQPSPAADIDPVSSFTPFEGLDRNL